VEKVQLKDKNQIGAAIEDLEPPEDMSVQGRDLLTGKPKQVEVSYREIAKVRQINSKN
jgi:rod shape-determining protein MreB